MQNPSPGALGGSPALLPASPPRARARAIAAPLAESLGQCRERDAMRQKTAWWRAQECLDKLKRQPGIQAFQRAVDEERDNAPGYYSRIAKPVDLAIITNRLENAVNPTLYPNKERYASPEELNLDVLLMLSNCKVGCCGRAGAAAGPKAEGASPARWRGARVRQPPCLPCPAGVQWPPAPAVRHRQQAGRVLEAGVGRDVRRCGHGGRPAAGGDQQAQRDQTSCQQSCRGGGRQAAWPADARSPVHAWRLVPGACRRRTRGSWARASPAAAAGLLP